MRTKFRILCTLALAAVGASMAHGSAHSYGESYASATYYQSQAGLYFTASSGQYYGYSTGAVGGNWFAYDYYYGAVPNTQYSADHGYGSSWAQPGGAGEYSFLATENFVTVSNLSSHFDTLYVDVYTDGYGSSYASSWNDFSYGVGLSQVWDTAGTFYQSAYGLAETFGLGLGGNYSEGSYYDPYNGSQTSQYFGGGLFPAYLYGYARDFQVYTLSFAPGASDTFYTYASESHSDYSFTPGPAAVVPFALGLCGALRRRKRA